MGASFHSRRRNVNPSPVSGAAIVCGRAPGGHVRGRAWQSHATTVTIASKRSASGPGCALRTGGSRMAQAVQDLPAPPAGAMSLPRPAVPRSIVPLRGLPIVAVVIAGMIAAIASNKLWPLEFYHVVGGALWTGIDLFVGLIIGPILGTLSIPARVEFSSRFMPKMALLMPTLVTMTLGAGWQLARHLGNLDAGYAQHGW